MTSINNNNRNLSVINNLVKNLHPTVLRLLPILFVFLAASYPALSAHIGVTVIKQPLCGCDGEIEIDLSECLIEVSAADQWMILKSSTNPMSWSNPGTPSWNSSGELSKYVHYSESGHNIPSRFRISGLCPGDWYFYFAWMNNGQFSTIGGESNLTALHITLQGSANPLHCDVTLAECGCYYKMATAVITGGTPPYTITWDPNIKDPDHIPAGTYWMKVVDANGCECIKEFTVTTEATLPEVSIKVIPKGCNPATANGGCVEISGAGLTGKNIVWKKTYPTQEMGPTGNATQWCGLQPGDKGVVRIMDLSLGCLLELPWEIPPFTPITFSLKTTAFKQNNSCYGRVDVIDLVGGDAPYTYTWNGSSTTPTTSVRLLPATFIVTVKDKNGCEHTQQVTMECPPGLRGISINPNPWSVYADVTFEISQTAVYSYKLYDANLIEVRSVSLGTLNPTNHTTTVDGTGLQTGVYYIIIAQDGIPDQAATMMIKE